jgi:hypothetical protein
MHADPVRIERRSTQRFGFNLRVRVRVPGRGHEAYGVTQNLSARGAFFYTDSALSVGDPIELTLVMPSEITLTDKMPVRCRGRVMRVAPPAGGNAYGIAVHLEGYEFLPEAEAAAKGAGTFERVSSLQEQPESEELGMSSHIFHPRVALRS